MRGPSPQRISILNCVSQFLLHVHNENTMPPPPHPQPGKYLHYKGNAYHVLGVAHHSETMEELVVYRALYGERGLWVRPLAMFCESVTVDGQTVARFRYVGPYDNE